ncbi:Collagen triple helix repeat-containing protein 1 [Holothuria leucospilota]|uniref:Collagen triple helix repeat-containing protein 1 n=1 Tax=Holothuria leucospilota TaxID=206669 RepID=A0A9Q1C0P3_HOLLE|nr:Collagen triple helix repeat-containing protein 1 [Holothuria leucospilota]
MAVFARCFLVTVIYIFVISSGEAGQSCVGPRGPPGPQGDVGDVGSGTDDAWYDVTPSRNWKECVWKSETGTDNGVVYTCSFTKESSTSSLFVAYGGTTRLYGCHGCCGVCDGLSSGSIDVAINAGLCSGYGTFDLYTGWNAVSRILIEEWPASPY